MRSRDRRRGRCSWSSREWRPGCRGRRPRSARRRPGFGRRPRRCGVCPRSRSLCRALAVFLAADVAGGGQVGEHLAEVLHDLPLEARRLRLSPSKPSAVSSLRGRPRLRGGGGLSGAGGSSLPSLALFWTGFSRASISVASRAIAPMMRPPSARSIRRGVDLVWQFAACELGDARKTWLRKELASVAPRRGCDAGTCRRRGARSGLWWLFRFRNSSYFSTSGLKRCSGMSGMRS